jgi:hypothetical protein
MRRIFTTSVASVYPHYFAKVAKKGRSNEERDELSRRLTGCDEASQYYPEMAEYLIYFNQQWVGDHTEEWFRQRGPLAMAVVEDMKAAGVYVFAGGLEEDPDRAFSADANGGTLSFTDGPFVRTDEFLGGFTVVDVADDEAARIWAGRLAEACGWPQEVRRFKTHPQAN